jgi:hypothetical protein
VKFMPHCRIFKLSGNSRLCLAMAAHQRAAGPIVGSDIRKLTLKMNPEKALKNEAKRRNFRRFRISSRRAPRHG